MTTSTTESPLGAFNSQAFVEAALAAAWQKCIANQQAEHAVKHLAIERKQTQAERPEQIRAEMRMPTERPTGTHHMVAVEDGSAMRIVSPFECESIA